MQVLETVLAYCRAKLSASLNRIYNRREGACDDLLLALRADPVPRHPPAAVDSTPAASRHNPYFIRDWRLARALSPALCRR